MEIEGEESATLSTTLQAPQSDTVLRRGESLGRYVILERIGAGAAGIVYSAYDPRLDRRVALKLLREGAARAQTRFLREMRALAQLQHRNIVTLYDATEIEGQPFLAMELCPGGTLTEWCTAAPRTPRELLGVFLEAGEGLAAAHAAGFIHRDFKPANVLMGSDGHPRVGDFGLVRTAAESLALDEHHASPEGTAPAFTATGARVGTLAYMASEQLRGDVATPRPRPATSSRIARRCTARCSASGRLSARTPPRLPQRSKVGRGRRRSGPAPSSGSGERCVAGWPLRRRRGLAR